MRILYVNVIVFCCLALSSLRITSPRSPCRIGQRRLRLVSTKLIHVSRAPANAQRGENSGLPVCGSGTKHQDVFGSASISGTFCVTPASTVQRSESTSTVSMAVLSETYLYQIGSKWRWNETYQVGHPNS